MRTGNCLVMGCICISLAFVSACDKLDDDPPKHLSASDRAFMNKASMANWAEVKFGELAALNGKHVAVRKFGAQMVVDHNQALLDLKVIAFAWGVELPVVMDSLHNAKYRKLQGMSGYSFDTAYINSQIKDHDEAIALFQEEATGGDDKQLRNYAARYLPHLHMHREKIDSVNSVVR